MQQNQITPVIRQVAGNKFNEIWFQQDSASPHFGNVVWNYLSEVFQDRWIGRRGGQHVFQIFHLYITFYEDT